MIGPRLPPTRMSLIRARRRLERLGRSVTLLRRKREALVTELFRLARPAVEARVAIEDQAARAYAALWPALGLHGRTGLAAFGRPLREVAIALEPRPVWGVPAADLVRLGPVVRTPEARGAAPSATGPAAATAARRFETLTELLLDAAARELRLRRLGEALARTSRQVNSLEHRLAPAWRGEVGSLRRVLDEREREERIRLLRVAGA